MATEIQYKVFEKLFDEEQRRYSGLATRGNLYLTIITFYLGVVVLKLDDVAKFVSGFHLPIILFLGIGGLLAVALLLTVLALGIHEFEGVCDPEQVIQNFGSSPPKDEEFLDSRIVDLAVATNRNHNRDEQIAAKLQWAAHIIFLAAMLQIVVFLMAILQAKHFPYAQTTQTKTRKCECQQESADSQLRGHDASSAQQSATGKTQGNEKEAISRGEKNVKKKKKNESQKPDHPCSDSTPIKPPVVPKLGELIFNERKSPETDYREKMQRLMEERMATRRKSS